MASPFPDLQDYPFDNLSFPWAEKTGGVSPSDGHLGEDGVAWGMVMYVYWKDLPKACYELLGYSWRDTETQPPNSPGISGPNGPNYWLRRVLPWQHPYFNQLFVKSISSIKGIRMAGTNTISVDDFSESPSEGSTGSGLPNLGPWSDYFLAELTIQFWRPTYAIRSDEDILDDFGNPQEWLRYLDKEWQVDTQMLSREGMVFKYVNGGLAGTFPGSVGQKVTHLKLKRRWHNIPEAAIFALVDGVPNGVPKNQLYTTTQTENPITGYIYAGGKSTGFCVNSPIGGGTTDTADLRFLGFPMGTLLLEGIEFIPKPLPLPPYLMDIPAINNEPISQVQYDVVFHWDYFDPPAGSGESFQGHNLMPYPGNGLWYAVQSQQDDDDPPTTSGDLLTPFQYIDMTDLFRIL